MKKLIALVGLLLGVVGVSKGSFPIDRVPHVYIINETDQPLKGVIVTGKTRKESVNKARSLYRDGIKESPVPPRSVLFLDYDSSKPYPVLVYQYGDGTVYGATFDHDKYAYFKFVDVGKHIFVPGLEPRKAGDLVAADKLKLKPYAKTINDNGTWSDTDEPWIMTKGSDIVVKEGNDFNFEIKNPYIMNPVAVAASAVGITAALPFVVIGGAAIMMINAVPRESGGYVSRPG